LTEEIVPLASNNSSGRIDRGHVRASSLTPRTSTPSPVRRAGTPTIHTQPIASPKMEPPKSPTVNGTRSPEISRPGGTPRASVESDIREAVGEGLHEEFGNN
jgi:hypothetical protein